MLKTVLKIDGIKFLDRSSQKEINGGEYEYGECPTPNSFFCGVPDHICCNGLCVLPTHGACGFF